MYILLYRADPWGIHPPARGIYKLCITIVTTTTSCSPLQLPYNLYIALQPPKLQDCHFGGRGLLKFVEMSVRIDQTQTNVIVSVCLFLGVLLKSKCELVNLMLTEFHHLVRNTLFQTPKQNQRQQVKDSKSKPTCNQFKIYFWIRFLIQRWLDSNHWTNFIHEIQS